MMYKYIEGGKMLERLEQWKKEGTATGRILITLSIIWLLGYVIFGGSSVKAEPEPASSQAIAWDGWAHIDDTIICSKRRDFVEVYYNLRHTPQYKTRELITVIERKDFRMPSDKPLIPPSIYNSPFPGYCFIFK